MKEELDAGLIKAIAEKGRSGVAVYPDDWILMKAEISAAGYEPERCVLVAKDFKQRIREYGNHLVQMACNGPKEQDDRLTLELRVLAQTLSYLLNSSSFEAGKLYDFDKEAIDRKLGRGLQ